MSDVKLHVFQKKHTVHLNDVAHVNNPLHGAVLMCLEHCDLSCQSSSRHTTFSLIETQLGHFENYLTSCVIVNMCQPRSLKQAHDQVEGQRSVCVCLGCARLPALFYSSIPGINHYRLHFRAIKKKNRKIQCFIKHKTLQFNEDISIKCPFARKMKCTFLCIYLLMAYLFLHIHAISPFLASRFELCHMTT